jgi:hypothetical protein
VTSNPNLATMSNERWYSTAVRILCHVDGVIVDCWEPVHVFQARDDHHSFERALELGRSHNEEYLNRDAESVRWEFIQVLTLDTLGDELRDGHEVWMRTFRLPISEEVVEQILSEAPGSPEGSSPDLTGV